MSHSFATPWTVARQAPLSMGFPRQEYWSRLPFPSPGDSPRPGIKPVFLALQVDSLPLSHQGSPFMHVYIYYYLFAYCSVIYFFVFHLTIYLGDLSISVHLLLPYF